MWLGGAIPWTELAGQCGWVELYRGREDKQRDTVGQFKDVGN